MPADYSGAKALGARCDECALRGVHQPVLGDHPEGAPFVAVGELPGREEVLSGRPFVGDAGRELDKALAGIGLSRRSGHDRPAVTNVLACRPASEELKKVVQRIDKANRERPNEPPQPTPIECCLPRMLAEVKDYPNILALGTMALRALQGSTALGSDKGEGIMAQHGALSELHLSHLLARHGLSDPYQGLTGRRFLATFNPAFVLRQLRWTEPFRQDVAKAWRWFTGRLTWVDPQVTYHPKPDELRQILARWRREHEWTVYDVETDAKAVVSTYGRCWEEEEEAWTGAPSRKAAPLSPLTAWMLCLGIGTPPRPVLARRGDGSTFQGLQSEVVVIGCWSIPGTKRLRGANRQAGLGISAPPPTGPAGVPGDALEPWQGYAFGYTLEEFKEIKAILREWAQDRDHVKAGWNSGYYDRAAMEQWLNVTPGPILDGILVHRLVASELPHTLDHVGSSTVDVHKWKAGHIGSEGDDDVEMHVYNATDNGVEAQVVPAVLEQAIAREQEHLIPGDHFQQHMCAWMHRNGMWIDQRRRAQIEVELDRKIAESEALCQEIATRYGVTSPSKRTVKELDPETGRVVRRLVQEPHNPRSFPQVAHLLYEVWKYPVPHYTLEGARSTDDKALRTLMRDPRVSEEAREYLDGRWQVTTKTLPDGSTKEERRRVCGGLRQNREHTKARSTFVRPLRPWAMEWEASDGKLVRGRCLEDERLHFDYNAHTPATGRISSSGPNAQNIPDQYRACMRPASWHRMAPATRVRWAQTWLDWLERWRGHAESLGVTRKQVEERIGWAWAVVKAGGDCPAPGGAQLFPRVFVAADESQLELRISAALAGCDKYLRIFAEGGDPHAVTAELLYGEAFLRELQRYQATGKKSKAFTEMRNFAKTFVYLVTYGGSAETAWQNLTATEDPKTGALVYANVKQPAVEALRAKWLRGAPEYERWWNTTLEEYRHQGHLRDPVDGRRRDFLDGEDFNEIVNFKVQAGGAAIVKRATARMMDRFGGLLVNGQTIPWSIDQATDSAGAPLGQEQPDGSLLIPVGKRMIRVPWEHRTTAPLSWERAWVLWGPGSGQVTQTHDSNVLEVPARERRWVEGVVQTAMSFHPCDPALAPPGGDRGVLDVPFEGEADSSTRWSKA